MRITSTNRYPRKEVFQPHLPVRLPCYDLAPITSFALTRPLRQHASGTPGFHGLTGGVYKARERIHRVIADTRLLANPTSRGRVRSEEHTFELQSLMRISYAVFCLKKKITTHTNSN